MWWGLLAALEASGGSVDVERIARNLRIGASGGASLPVEIITKVKEKLGVTILEGYGLSETSPVATFSDPDQEPRPGSIGVPIWGIEVKLVDGAEWKSGSVIRCTSCSTVPNCRLQVSALSSRLAWESSAPLGWPVVPLV